MGRPLNVGPAFFWRGGAVDSIVLTQACSCSLFRDFIYGREHHCGKRCKRTAVPNIATFDGLLGK